MVPSGGGAGGVLVFDSREPILPRRGGFPGSQTRYNPGIGRGRGRADDAESMPMTERFFNTTGPVVPAKHYCVPPLERFDLDEILRLIRAERYFLLYAPRQTGKTSALLALRDLLNGSGEFRCLYVNVEAGQSARGDVEAAMRAILGRLATLAEVTLKDDFPKGLWQEALAAYGGHGALGELLTRWSMADARPSGKFTQGRAGNRDVATHPPRRYVIECKILGGSLNATIREGMKQTLDYMDRCAGESGHLVIFDRDGAKSWGAKLFRREESLDGKTVTVWGA